MKVVLLSLLLGLSPTTSYSLTIDELNELKSTIIAGEYRDSYFDYGTYLYEKETNLQHQQWILYLITLANSSKINITLRGISYVEAHLWTEIILKELHEYDPSILEKLEEGDQLEDETY